MSATEKRNITIVLNGKEVQNNVAAITREFHRQRVQLAKTQRGTAEYQRRLLELRKTKKILDDHRKNINGAQKAWSNLKSTFVGFFSATAAFSLLQRMGQNLVDLAKKTDEFAASQSNLAAILGKSRSQVKALTMDAKRLGAQTKFTAAEVTNLQTEYARLGFTQEEILKVTEPTLQLAAAANEDLGESAQVAGSAVRSFGLEATETQRVVDVMAKSFSSSALNMERWKESMKLAAPLARAAGVSIEETAAMLGKLADSGIHGSMAGTALKKVFNEVKEAGKPLSESLADIKVRLDNASSEAERLAIAEDLVGERGQAALLILANQTEGIDELTTSLQNAGGAAEEMAGTQLDNVGGDVTKFKSAYDGLVLALDDGTGMITKTRRGFIQMGTAILSAITPSEKMSEAIEKEQLNLNVLVSRLSAANISENERLKVINELKQNYPEFVKGIDIETASVSALKDQLALVNEQYVERILLQQQQEEVAEIAESIANTQRLGVEKEIEIRKKVAEAYAEEGKTVDLVGKSIEEIIELGKELDTGFLALSLKGDAKFLEINQGMLDSHNDKLSTLLDTHNEIKQRLGIGEGFIGPAQPTDLPSSGDLGQSFGPGEPEVEAKVEFIKGRWVELQDDLAQKMDMLETGQIDQHQFIEEQKVLITEEAAIMRNNIMATASEKFADEEFDRVVSRSKERIRVEQEMLQLGADTAFNILNASHQRRTESELAALESRRELGLTTEAEYEKQKLAIQKKAFQRKKITDIAQAIINGALAITKVQAQTGVLSPLAALPIIGQTAAQIGVIAAQKFGDGGEFLVGPSHDSPSQGMPVIDPTTGSVRALLEGEEFIMKKKAVRKYGVPFMRAVNEGSFPSINYSAFDRPRMYADGGPFSEEANESSGGASLNVDLLVREMRGIRQDIRMFETKKEVFVTYKSIEDAGARKDKIQSLADVA